MEYMVFEFYLAVWHVRIIVNFKNSYFPLFSNSDTKLVLYPGIFYFMTKIQTQQKLKISRHSISKLRSLTCTNKY